jgi:phospholipid/cholesterol/gamma-HCH transport system permease protein
LFVGDSDHSVSARGWELVEGNVVALSGDWTTGDAPGSRLTAAREIVDSVRSGTIKFDSQHLGRWDSTLLVFIYALRQATRERGLELDESGLPEAVRRLLSLTADTEAELPAKATDLSIVARVGRAVIAVGAEVVAVVTMVGETVLRVGAFARRHVRMRGIDLLTCAYDAGVSALPVVTVINILVGCILAFVGAVQLRRFGGDIYVASLVAIAMVREMAALMTGIAMSGRTGGAYAAHIATMQGSEEIDALRAIGIPVYDYLVLPRVLALTFMMPLLYLYGSAIGILGGFMVSIAMLNVSAEAFINQIRDSVAESQIVFGLVKSIAFGLLIAIAGCRTGLRAGRSAADVGHAATTAVVVGIVGVIALDAVFAVCANALDF